MHQIIAAANLEAQRSLTLVRINEAIERAEQARLRTLALIDVWTSEDRKISYPDTLPIECR